MAKQIPACDEKPLTAQVILKTWWPLAFSWLLMSIEGPAVSAVIARMERPEINLAAFGGVIFPLALIIEAPVIMLLSASVALSSHRQAYRRLWTYMMVSGATLTALHILVAFTPLYYFVVERVIGAPEEIIEPARLGLMLMTPWTWAIGYRRFNQGVLIRYGYSGAVGMGTIVRLVVTGLALTAGFRLGAMPGAAVGALAQALSATAEAVYAGWRVRPVLKRDLPGGDQGSPLSWSEFAKFYIPLALTSLITLIWQPVGSAGMSRMPAALASLAVWPVVSGLAFFLRSFGMAYNEVVVALLSRKGSWQQLRHFGLWLILATTGLYLVIALTPLSDLYFGRVAALPQDLSEMAIIAFWFALPMPALSVLQNLFQGSLLFGKQTRGVPESVAIFLATVLLVISIGVAVGRWTGLYVTVAALILANFTQLGWLWVRSRPVVTFLKMREAGA